MGNGAPTLVAEKLILAEKGAEMKVPTVEVDVWYEHPKDDFRMTKDLGIKERDIIEIGDTWIISWKLRSMDSYFIEIVEVYPEDRFGTYLGFKFRGSESEDMSQDIQRRITTTHYMSLDSKVPVPPLLHICRTGSMPPCNACLPRDYGLDDQEPWKYTCKHAYRWRKRERSAIGEDWFIKSDDDKRECVPVDDESDPAVLPIAGFTLSPEYWSECVPVNDESGRSPVYDESEWVLIEPPPAGQASVEKKNTKQGKKEHHAGGTGGKGRGRSSAGEDAQQHQGQTGHLAGGAGGNSRGRSPAGKDPWQYQGKTCREGKGRGQPLRSTGSSARPVAKHGVGSWKWY